MAKAQVTVKSIASDGSNLFLEIEVFNGDVTESLIRPVFPVGTSLATIRSYLQTIANNRPTISSDLVPLINSPVVEA